MAKYDEILTKELLEKYYHTQQLNPHEIAEKLKCNHKTVRSYLKKHNIKLRNISEYNSLAGKTYTEPTDELLYSPLSIAMHSMYQCEGSIWNGMNALSFCNRDYLLIKTFAKGLINIYKYESQINIRICYNFDCEKSKKLLNKYLLLLESDFKIAYKHNKNYPNPVLILTAGGKRLSELFVNNINKINNYLESL